MVPLSAVLVTEPMATGEVKLPDASDICAVNTLPAVNVPVPEKLTEAGAPAIELTQNGEPPTVVVVSVGAAPAYVPLIAVLLLMRKVPAEFDEFQPTRRNTTLPPTGTATATEGVTSCTKVPLTDEENGEPNAAKGPPFTLD